ncbi:hypothetical protein ACW9HJ_01270 [Nocardia gipuzkoensis]
MEPRHPEILPMVGGSVMDDRGVRLAAAYAASGAVGAIESWLSTGPIGNLSIPAALIHASSASWWFQPVETDHAPRGR